MRISKLSVGAAVVLATVSFAASALAQEAGASGEVGMTLPGGGPKAQATEGETDHDQMVGRFAVGYLGARSVPMAGLAGTTLVAADQQAPVIGMRYWLDQGMGLDVGLGFLSTSGSTKSGNVSSDKAGVNAVLLHAGVPLALANHKHFSWQLVPEVNIGFAQQTQKDFQAANDELKLSGLLVEVGVRVGGELHFGFMGVPELSLQGSVGAVFQTTTRSGEYTPPAGASTSFEDKNTVIGTTVYDNPWNIFTSNVAALYYF
jgi:hypothetical protein